LILVIGGRSKIGSALIETLVSKGETVRALVRSGEGKDSLPQGAEAAVGDLADPESLRAAMGGVDRVFLLCGPNEDEVALNRNAIDAAREAGVDLLVRSSILGSDPSSQATFTRDHGQCDAYLKESGVPYSLIRPNLFLQNIPENTIPSIGDDGKFYANASDARISMVDTRDVAAVAAEVLTTPGLAGDEYDVTGPEAISYGDVASKLSGALGREVTYVDAPDDSVRDALAGYGMGDWLVGALVDLYQDYKRSGSDGYAAQTTDTVERLTGASPRTLDQLLDELPAPSPA
jgi:uncharacterized protein YbjT (DUF2867 family)